MIETLHDWLLDAFRWTIDVSLLGSLLIVVVLCGRSLLRDAMPARWMYAVWLVVILRLALPIAPESSLSVFNLISHEASSASEPANAELVLPTRVLDPVAVVPEQADLAPAAHSPSEPGHDVMGPAVMRVPSLGPAANPAPSVVLLPFVWFAGFVFIALTIAVRSTMVACRFRNGKSILDPVWIESLCNAKRVMHVRRSVQIVETDDVHAPALYGLVRVRILIPTTLKDRLTPQQQSLVLMHELAHMKRCDIAINWVAAVVQAVHWFNPLVWIAFVLMRQDREAACDANVMAKLNTSERFVYGKTLLQLAEGCGSQRLAGAVGILESKSNLRRRLRSIAAYRRPGSSRHAISLAALLFLAATTLTNATSAAAPPSSEDSQESNQRDAQWNLQVAQTESDVNAQDPDSTEPSSQGLRVRDLGEPPFGTFRRIQSRRCSTFQMNKDGIATIHFEMFPGPVVGRWDNATVFADRAVAAGGRYWFEGNVRIPELWGDDSKADAIEFGRALPDWVSLKSYAQQMGSEDTVQNRDSSSDNVELFELPATVQDRLRTSVTVKSRAGVVVAVVLQAVELNLHVPIYEAVDGDRVPLSQSNRLNALRLPEFNMANVSTANLLTGLLSPFDLRYSAFDDVVVVGSAEDLVRLRESEKAQTESEPNKQPAIANRASSSDESLDSNVDNREFDILTQKLSAKLGLPKLLINMLILPNEENPQPAVLINYHKVYVNEFIPDTKGRVRLIGVDNRGIAVEVDGERYYYPKSGWAEPVLYDKLDPLEPPMPMQFDTRDLNVPTFTPEQ